MNKVRLYFVAGAFALGIILTLAAVYVFIDRSASAASALPSPTAPVSMPAAEIVRDVGSSPADVERGTSPGAADGLTEGVKVHGRWTIEILEPDGTLVSKQEFENGLFPSGSRRIGEMLSREIFPMYWGIVLEHNFLSSSACIATSLGPWPCNIEESQSTSSGNQTFKNLVVSTSTDGVLTLKGTATAQRDGAITRVKTTHVGRLCAPGEFPDSCSGTIAGIEVTRTQLPTAIDVAEGQIMSVTVEISFE